MLLKLTSLYFACPGCIYFVNNMMWYFFSSVPNCFTGIEYIYEIHRRTTIGKPYYLCTLCDVGHIEVVPHVTCKDHRQIYFVSRLHLNSLAPGRCGSNFKSVNFEHMLWIKFMNPSVKLFWGECHRTPLMLNQCSGNGLVPSGNKLLPEPMLTQIYATKWHC